MRGWRLAQRPPQARRFFRGSRRQRMRPLYFLMREKKKRREGEVLHTHETPRPPHRADEDTSFDFARTKICRPILCGCVVARRLRKKSRLIFFCAAPGRPGKSAANVLLRQARRFLRRVVRAPFAQRRAAFARQRARRRPFFDAVLPEIHTEAARASGISVRRIAVFFTKGKTAQTAAGRARAGLFTKFFSAAGLTEFLQSRRKKYIFRCLNFTLVPYTVITETKLGI